MRSIEVPLGVGASVGGVRTAVRSAAQALGLTVRSYTTLKSYPGSHHWHLAKPAQTGTLEVTFWPRENRLWLSAQRARNTLWVRRGSRAMAVRLARSLARRTRRAGKSSVADSRN